MEIKEAKKLRDALKLIPNDMLIRMEDLREIYNQNDKTNKRRLPKLQDATGSSTNCKSNGSRSEQSVNSLVKFENQKTKEKIK